MKKSFNLIGVIIVWFLIIILFYLLVFNLLFKSYKAVKKEGLKNVVNEMWEGEGGIKK